MRIAVFGTGVVGKTLAVAFDRLDHDVAIGTRDVATTMSRADSDRWGNPPYAVWAQEHPRVRLAAFADAAAAADVIVNATEGFASLEALAAAGTPNLAGKVVIDVSNPLDFSGGFPPTLFTANTDSLAEQIQRTFPQARVVKALNTVTAALMADPDQLAGGDFTIFIAGDDKSAKALVVDLLAALGHRDVIDIGDITCARGVEMILPLWTRLAATLSTPLFSIKIVR